MYESMETHESIICHSPSFGKLGDMEGLQSFDIQRNKLEYMGDSDKYFGFLQRMVS